MYVQLYIFKHHALFSVKLFSWKVLVSMVDPYKYHHHIKLICLAAWLLLFLLLDFLVSNFRKNVTSLENFIFL